ncbi:hypothetical protein B0T22DRAFT_447498 [Podospora appendiculata]|uniref:Uncharacterized protein n=1 Tax=Podospora appendiculata TaxID=314037 RepID=A0AAE1CFQ9_9PEZI|nr:hypothetical protein B0T22DRAFT_447498 [Podospora appendiculata]
MHRRAFLSFFCLSLPLFLAFLAKISARWRGFLWARTHRRTAAAKTYGAGTRRAKKRAKRTPRHAKMDDVRRLNKQ